MRKRSFIHSNMTEYLEDEKICIRYDYERLPGWLDVMIFNRCSRWWQWWP
jgi:hypothetical protein